MLFLLFSSIGLLGSGLVFDRLNHPASIDTRSQAVTETASLTPTECPEPYPPQKLTAIPGTNPGEINVSWVRPGGQHHFAVSFGKEPSKYLWGQADIGNTRQFTIRFLEPGIRYYLIVATVNECGGIKNSAELSAVAKAVTPLPITKSTPPPTNGLTAKPQVFIAPEDIEPLVMATLSAIPATPSATPELTLPPTANQTLFDRLKENPLLIVIIGIIIGLLSQKLFAKKRPPSLTQIKPQPHALKSQPITESPSETPTPQPLPRPESSEMGQPPIM
jgi:hypothetical protein